MGHPKDTSGCHCVLSLCHLMYCHLPKYLTMAYEKIQKILIPPNWHQSCHSSVYMAHSKSSSNLSPSCSFTHSASDHPSTPPPVVPTGRFWGPRPSLSTASTAAPAARSCSTAAVWPLPAAQCSGVRPQAPKGSETSTAGSTTWLSTAHPHCSGRNCNLWSEVREFHLFQHCIVSWFNGSHYRCWCLWRSPRLRTRKSEKGKTDFLRLRKLISTYLKYFQALFHTHTVGPSLQVANVQEFFFLKMFYDVLWCFTSMSYHRHAENVLSKVDIACGQFVLYVWRDGAPEKCQWMPLCSVALTPHVSPHPKYLTIAFEKIPKIQIPSTANTTY